jgi:Xylanase inhibitor C-terminal
LSDKFTFKSSGYLPSYFEVPCLGNSSTPAEATGLISFSKSNDSVVSHLRAKRFSYFISYNSNSNSSFLLGDKVSIPPTRPGIQSTNLIPNTNFPDLYFVHLSYISVGGNHTPINLDAGLASSVILDTIIPATLLAVPVYKQVMATLKAQIGRPEADKGTNSLEMCYGNSTNWPNLILSFGTAKMVLRKENYVVRDDAAGLECAAILPSPSQGYSVIGSMAQLDREMVFDNDRSMLYFDQYPKVAFSGDGKTKHTKALNLLAVFILFILCW